MRGRRESPGSGFGSGRINPLAAAKSLAVSLFQPLHMLADHGVRLGHWPWRAFASKRGFRSLKVEGAVVPGALVSLRSILKMLYLLLP